MSVPVKHEFRTMDAPRTPDQRLERYVRRVSQLVGYDSPPPEQIRLYIERLKTEGFSASAAAREVRILLEVNTP